jgi:hypothetical protein
LIQHFLLDVFDCDDGGDDVYLHDGDDDDGVYVYDVVLMLMKHFPMTRNSLKVFQQARFSFAYYSKMEEQLVPMKINCF